MQWIFCHVLFSFTYTPCRRLIGRSLLIFQAKAGWSLRQQSPPCHSDNRLDDVPLRRICGIHSQLWSMRTGLCPCTRIIEWQSEPYSEWNRAPSVLRVLVVEVCNDVHSKGGIVDDCYHRRRIYISTLWLQFSGLQIYKRCCPRMTCEEFVFFSKTAWCFGTVS